MALVYCRNCGSEVRGKFCTKCGAPAPQDTGTATNSDAGATTVIRAEDLLKMESLNSDAGGTVQMPTPNWDDGNQSAGTSSWPGQQPSQPSEPAWGSDPASQQWQGTTSGDTSGQGWQQSTPQYGATSGPSYGETSGPSYGQTGGPSYGQTSETNAGYGSASSGGGQYAQPLGAFTGSAVAATTDIGGLFSGAMNIVTSRIQQVIQIVLIYAAVLAVAGLIIGIGSKLPVIGFLFDLIGYVGLIVASAVPVAAFITLAQDAQSGTVSSVSDMMPRVQAILPSLIIAIVLLSLIVGVASILLVIPGIIAAFLLIFVPQAVVVDHTGATGSLRQSFDVVKSNLGTTFLALLVLYVVLGIVGALSMIVFIPAIFLLLIPVIGWIFYFAIVGIVSGIIGAFALSYTTLLYNGLKQQSGMESRVGAASTGGYSSY